MGPMGDRELISGGVAGVGGVMDPWLGWCCLIGGVLGMILVGD